jgi:hypothetical protein
LVNRWWADAEVFLHVGFGRRTAVQPPHVQVDIGQILALLGGEGFSRATPLVCFDESPSSQPKKPQGTSLAKFSALQPTPPRSAQDLAQ